MTVGRSRAQRAAPALCALALCLSGAPALAADQLFEPEAGAEAPPDRLARVHPDNVQLVTIELGRYLLAEAVEGYGDERGLCLDLAQLTRALDFPIEVDVGAASANGWYRSETTRFELNGNRVRYGESQEAVEGADLKRSDNGLCVGTDAAERWFGIDIDWIRRESRVRVSSDEKLPAERRIEREQRHEQFLRRSALNEDLSEVEAYSAPYLWWRTPSVDLVATLGAIRQAGRRAMDGIVRYSAYAAGEIARLSFDAQLGSDNDGAPASLRARVFRRDPAGGLLGPLGATEFALGDVQLPATGFATRAAAGRGAFISNAPLHQPLEFDRTSFYGELPPGWDAELYRNGALVGIGLPTADGRYAFEDVQLLFGENRFEIVLHGPQGQERRQEQRLVVGAGGLKAGQTVYRAGIVEDGQSLVTFRDSARESELQAFASVAHGVSTTTALGAELIHVRTREDRRSTYMVLNLQQVTPIAIVDFDLAADMEGGKAASARLSTSLGGVSLSGSSAWFDGFESVAIGREVRSRHEVALDVPLGPLATVGAQARFTDHRDRGDTVLALGRLSSRLRGLSVTQQLEYERGAHLSGGDRMATTSFLGGRLGDVQLTGIAEFELQPQREFAAARLQATYPLSDRSSLRGEIEHDRQAGYTRLRAGYAHRFQRFAIGADAEVSDNGDFAVGLNLAMSFGPGAHGRFARLSADKLASRPQVAARLFSDLNDDGAYQPGEPLQPDVRLKAGGRAGVGETAADGVAYLDTLQPDRKVRIDVDLASLPDPFLLPPEGGRVILPRSGVITQIDLPLAPSGEVEGTIYLDDAELSGAGLVLRDREGKAAATARSEYDGFFLFQQVRYGRYTLTLDADSAAQLGRGAGEPLASVDVSAANAIANVGSIVVRLLPRLQTAGEPRAPPPGAD